VLAFDARVTRRLMVEAAAIWGNGRPDACRLAASPMGTYVLVRRATMPQRIELV
jgi:hypothetical protein